MCALYWGRLWHLHASFDIKSKNNRQRFCVCVCVDSGPRGRAAWPLRRLSIRPVFVLCIHINVQGETRQARRGETSAAHLIVVATVNCGLNS